MWRLPLPVRIAIVAAVLSVVDVVALMGAEVYRCAASGGQPFVPGIPRYAGDNTWERTTVFQCGPR